MTLRRLPRIIWVWLRRNRIRAEADGLWYKHVSERVPDLDDCRRDYPDIPKHYYRAHYSLDCETSRQATQELFARFLKYGLSISESMRRLDVTLTQAPKKIDSAVADFHSESYAQAAWSNNAFQCMDFEVHLTVEFPDPEYIKAELMRTTPA